MFVMMIQNAPVHDFDPTVPLLLLAALVVATIYWLSRRARRERVLANWAQAHGLRFNHENDEDLLGRLRDEDLIDRFLTFQTFSPLAGDDSCYPIGWNPCVSNTIRGRWAGKDIIAFDLQYATDVPGAVKVDAVTSKDSISAVMFPCRFPLKPLMIRPEWMGDKIARAFRKYNIEPMSFNSRFHVESSDGPWADEVVHPEMMDFLMSSHPFCIAMNGQHIIVYQNSLFTARDLEDACGVGAGIIDRLPAEVTGNQGRDAS